MHKILLTTALIFMALFMAFGSTACQSGERVTAASAEVVSASPKEEPTGGRPPCDPRGTMDYYQYKYPSHICFNEVTDTTFHLLKGGQLTLGQLFNNLLPMQRIGREDNDHNDDPYLNKAEKGAFEDFIESFMRKHPSDTIFIKEDIYRDGDYVLSFWVNPDEVFYIRAGTLNVTSVKNDRELQYIDAWRKDELMYYGECEQYRGRYNTGSSSRCVSRVIITGNFIRIDMFKYYLPLWPEDYHKYHNLS